MKSSAAFAASHWNLSGRSRFGEDSAAGPRSHCGHENHCDEPVKAFTLVALGLAIAAMGIYVADADDAPGAAVIGMLLMVVEFVRACVFGDETGRG